MFFCPFGGRNASPLQGKGDGRSYWLVRYSIFQRGHHLQNLLIADFCLWLAVADASHLATAGGSLAFQSGSFAPHPTKSIVIASVAEESP